MIAGETPFSREHSVATAKCKTCETDRSARSSRQKTASCQKELVHFFQSAACACVQNASLGIELHFAHRRNTDEQSIVVQAKSFKGMSPRFYRDGPILCLRSFDRALNASLRYTTGDN